MNTLLSQRDVHWVNHRIGLSPYTIGKQGCALTGVSMVSGEFGGFKDPAQIASCVPLFTPQGLIQWDKIQRLIPCIKFIWRQYGESAQTISNFLVLGQKASLLQVPINPGKNEYHWLKAVKPVLLKHGLDYLCINTWTGMECYAKATYGRITGSAHFTKV